MSGCLGSGVRMGREVEDWWLKWIIGVCTHMSAEGLMSSLAGVGEASWMLEAYPWPALEGGLTGRAWARGVTRKGTALLLTPSLTPAVYPHHAVLPWSQVPVRGLGLLVCWAKICLSFLKMLVLETVSQWLKATKTSMEFLLGRWHFQNWLWLA